MRLFAKPVAVMLVTLTVIGCSTHYTTLVRESDNRQVIYRIPEAQAFRIVLDAFAEVLPKQSLFDITGPQRGYHAKWRWGIDTYTQKVLIVPAIGTDTSGRDVHGYWFDVSGEGTSESGVAKNQALYRRILEAVEATGTSAIVTNVRAGQYESDEHVHRAWGRDASKAAQPGGRGIADHLRELKSLLDQGLITKEEYDAKRREILDKM